MNPVITTAFDIQSLSQQTDKLLITDRFLNILLFFNKIDSVR